MMRLPERMRLIHWAAVCLLGIIVVSALVVFTRSAPLPPLPKPNGYDDLRKAGSALPDGLTDYQSLSHPELRALVQRSELALRLVRAGLDRECRVPLAPSRTFFETHMPTLDNMKRLAHIFVAEGMLAEKEGRTNEAARAYLDIIRLGQEMVRGGVLLDAMVGLACESMGSSRLEQLVPSLSTHECRHWARELGQVASRRQDPAETLRVERWWSNESHTFLEQIGGMMAARAWNPARKPYDRYRSRLEGELARQTRLVRDLETRASTPESAAVQ